MKTYLMCSPIFADHSSAVHNWQYSVHNFHYLFLCVCVSVNVSPGSGGCSNPPCRNGTDAPCSSSSSSTGGAVPKAKLRKKVTSHPNTHSGSQPHTAHQVLAHQLHSRIQQRSPANGHLQCLSNSVSNGIMHPVSSKNVPKNQVRKLIALSKKIYFND